MTGLTGLLGVQFQGSVEPMDELAAFILARVEEDQALPASLKN